MGFVRLLGAAFILNVTSPLWPLDIPLSGSLKLVTFTFYSFVPFLLLVVSSG